MLIRNIARTTRIDDLKNLVVAYRDGQVISLDQVASIDYAARTKRGDAGYMGKPAVIVSVEKQPGVDTLRLSAEIKAALEALRHELPADVEVTTLFEQARFIDAIIATFDEDEDVLWVPPAHPLAGDGDLSLVQGG